MKTFLKIAIAFATALAACCCADKHNNFANEDRFSTIYKFEIGDEADGFYIDAIGKNTVLLKEQIEVDSLVFDGPDQFKDSRSYIQSKKGRKPKADIRILIYVLNTDQEFVESFSFNYGDFDYDTETFWSRDIDVKIDSGPVWTKNKLEDCLKIEFTQPDNGQGYKKWILSFDYRNDEWNLIARERISNVKDEKSEYGYCIDTINSRVFSPSKSVVITNELLQDLNCN